MVSQISSINSFSKISSLWKFTGENPLVKSNESQPATGCFGVDMWAQLPHALDSSHLPKNSDHKDSTTIIDSCRQGQIAYRPEKTKKKFLTTCYLVHTYIQVTPTSNFHKNNPSTSDYKVSRVWFRIFYGFSCSAHLKGSWKLWNSHTSSFNAVGPVEEISRRPLESVNSKKQKSTAMKWWQKKISQLGLVVCRHFFVPFC